jgi:predicted N-acetyltransferase YhbS
LNKKEEAQLSGIKVHKRHLEIRNEIPQDIPAVCKVSEAAFDTGAEADLVDRLRDKKAG